MVVIRTETGGTAVHLRRGEEEKATNKQSVSRLVTDQSRFRDRVNNNNNLLIYSSEKDVCLQKIQFNNFEFRNFI